MRYELRFVDMKEGDMGFNVPDHSVLMGAERLVIRNGNYDVQNAGWRVTFAEPVGP